MKGLIFGRPEEGINALPPISGIKHGKMVEVVQVNKTSHKVIVKNKDGLVTVISRDNIAICEE